MNATRITKGAAIVANAKPMMMSPNMISKAL
jgi:hypothetical protein